MNSSSQQIDMSSFNFAIACGACHPGGGPLETDRAGNRYDIYMKRKNYQSGGTNDLDGDYYKAMWTKTGVLEADCLICHMPGYRFKDRASQIKALNFRYAATVGAGLALVQGSIKDGQNPTVEYDPTRFDKTGHVRLKIVLEIPSENCLNCHGESDFKKRGASYIGQGVGHPGNSNIRCVTCHWAGSQAKDPRISGREMHEIGKGDDPGGFVSDNLDNTVRTCADCHESGKFGATLMHHRGIPPHHFKKLSCLVCHVPWRQAKAALIQDSTVFNKAPGIWPAPKRIWQFYGPDARPWNYYGQVHEEEMDFQRHYLFIPEKAWYKGKIWPVNRVHSLWVGIKRKGVPGIDMVFMKDYFMMWKAHENDPINNFPELSEIRDDNGDGVPEVNRTKEIVALLSSVQNYLEAKGEHIDKDDRVVFVRDGEFTADGQTWQLVKKFPWEASPYGSVFKFSHDIQPASSALGAKGCTDCHSMNSSFFFRPVLTGLWNENGHLSYEPNYRLLNYTREAVLAGAIRQEYMAPVMYWFTLTAFVILGLVICVKGPNLPLSDTPATKLMILIVTIAGAGPALVVVFGHFLGQMALQGLALFHKGTAILGLLLAIWLLATKDRKTIIFWLGMGVMLWQAVTGSILMFSEDENLRQIIFTIHDLGAMAGVGLAVIASLLFILQLPGNKTD